MSVLPPNLDQGKKKRITSKCPCDQHDFVKIALEKWQFLSESGQILFECLVATHFLVLSGSYSSVSTSLKAQYKCWN